MHGNGHNSTVGPILAQKFEIHMVYSTVHFGGAYAKFLRVSREIECTFYWHLGLMGGNIFDEIPIGTSLFPTPFRFE